ncbi:MAG: hypothetical protein V1874_11575 [Spirochaetota bacterium]
MQLENSNNKSSVPDSENIKMIEELFKEDDETIKEPDVNILRDRTFNQELSDLVARIRTNEPQGEDESPAPVEITDEDLLQMYHKLYYKSVNLTGIDKINTALNPFDLYKESSAEDLVNMIANEMQKIDLSAYLILVYDLKKKCYTSYTNNINDLDEINAVINNSEDLYKNIIKSKNGIIIDNKTLETNIYLHKRFPSKTPLYFISFDTIFNDFYREVNFENSSDLSGYFLPILVIQLNGIPSDQQIKSLYNKLKNSITIYLFLLQKKIEMDWKNPELNNMHSLFDFLDYTYQKFDNNKDYICSIIKLKNYITVDYLFIFKYLQIKLENKLINKSAVIRVEKDKLVVFTQKAKRKILEQILDEFNKMTNNLLQIEMFINDEISKNIYLLQNIKQQMVK